MKEYPPALRKALILSLHRTVVFFGAEQRVKSYIGTFGLE